MMNSLENYSISEKEKLDASRGCDLISDLPVCIIHIILAFVPIRDAVRTSILSTQWRYTWTTLPELTFDDDCVIREHQFETKYEKFIARVLFHHKGPIHKFKLSCDADFPRVDKWIFYLSRNGIQELIIDTEYNCSVWFLMWSSIYSCKRLTYLRLYKCELNPPPLNFKGFSFLRCLCLNIVTLSPDEIYSLVAACPLLEGFELIDEDELELKISAPNLKYMYLEGDYGKISINAPLLTELSVEIQSYCISMTSKQLRSSACSVCDYAKCCDGFTNLQKLTGSLYFIKYLSFGIKLCHYSLVFHHLKFIDLEVSFEDVNEIMVVGHIVIGAPNLQELKIRMNIWYDIPKADSEAPNFSFKDLGCASNFKWEKLTDVSLIAIDGNPLEVGFMKFLLEGSPVLDSMNVLLSNDTKEKQNELRDQLQGCNWASAIVKLRYLPSGARYKQPRLPFSLQEIGR